jgi:hypothetical protein
MASADLLGSMCWCVPKRIGVALIAIAFLLMGLSHLMVMLVDIMYAALGANTVATHPCQGSSCHDEWREQIFSCDGSRTNTFHVRYLTMGVLGPIFGALGIRGIIDRHFWQVKGFVVFMAAMWVLFVCCLISDLIFVGICASYPTAILRDVVPWLPPKAIAMVHALGYPSLDGLPVHTVDMALEYNLLIPYVTVFVFLLLVALYLIYNAHDLNEKMEGGPVGLGPLFLIATPVDREIATITSAIKQAQAEEDTKYDFHPAFNRLKDAERYPFLTAHFPQEPIGYGAVGLQRQEI